MRQINIEEFKAAVDADQVEVLIDVREVSEYAVVRVPGTTLIPMSEFQARLGEMEPHKGKTIYLICRSGGRSARVAMFLDSLGHDTINIGGGTMGWVNAGFETEP